MSKIKTHYLSYLIILILFFTSFISGGYFHYVSSLLSVFLILIYIYLLFKEKKIIIGINLNTLTLFIFIIFYLLSSFWAIDSSMSIYGFIKFFPVLLFYLIIHYVNDDKKTIIKNIPVIGCTMTILSFICMQLNLLDGIVSVNHRLAGFMQYPNTYALFMLVCFILSIDSLDIDKKNKISFIHIMISLFGIVMSGSKAIYILTFISLFILLFSKKSLRKYIIFTFIAIIVLSIIIFIIYQPTVSLSTFYGRLLYYKDALPVIIKHPFGLGYYGYFFIQNEIQTGIYTIVNVHNELLQIALDIGIIPALLFYIMIIKAIVKCKNKLILSVILLHSLFDYDFQFIFMFFILIIFLDIDHVKQYNISILTKGLIYLSSICILIVSIKLGLSDYYYMNGNYNQALKYDNQNTMAQIYQLTNISSYDEINNLTNAILEKNQHISYTYILKANIALSLGNVQDYIDYETLAIELNPYNYEEYTNYFNTLVQCIEQYQQSGDFESAEYCLINLQDIPSMLMLLEQKTSDIAYKTNDKPITELTQEQISKIKELEKSINASLSSL